MANAIGQVVFLDADVLARPVTRTLLIMAGDLVGTPAVWSDLAERQGNEHLPKSALPLDSLRERLRRELSPTGILAGRFEATSVADRQILADAEQSGAEFLITANVADFAEADLNSVGVAAVNPDLFLASWIDIMEYQKILDQFVENLRHPPRSRGELHALLGRQHPRLVSKFSELFPEKPFPATHPAPGIEFRGNRWSLS